MHAAGPPDAPVAARGDGPSAPSPAAPHREIELKLLLEPSAVERVLGHPALLRLAEGPATTLRLRSTYYDSTDLRLLRAGLALRVRRAGRRFVQTLKGRPEAAGLFERTEVEVAIDGPRPEPEAIADAELRGTVRRLLGDRPLDAVLETDVRRSSRLIAHGGTRLRADLDRGEIRTAAGQLPICELVLELVEGDPGELYRIALELHETVPLRLAVDSKFDRGLGLLLGEAPRPVKSRPLDVSPSDSLESAVERILASCFEQVLANEAAAFQGSDPEGVHQMRVGVRRLRSALSLFQSVLPREAVDALRKELRWLADVLGGARDLDVFQLEVLAPVLEAFPPEPAYQDLYGASMTLREERYDALRLALDSERYTALVLRLGAWIASRAWRDQPLSPDSARLFQPASEAARDLLRKRRRRVRRLARGIGEASSPEQLHALRIAIKKLRYASEFLGGAFDRKTARRFAKRAAGVQDALGHLNDETTARRLLDLLCSRLGDTAGPEHHHAAGVVHGWLARGRTGGLEIALRRWRSFKRLEPFWR